MVALKKSVPGAVIGLLWLAACGGGPSSSPTAMTTLTLSSTGVSPKAASVSAGSSVDFVNNDSVAHQLASNPDPQQVDCPELNSPLLAPGEQFTATLLTRNGTCAFEDSLNPTDSNFQGTITVTFAPATSPGGY